MMLVHRPEKIYDKSFFDWLYTGALESARTVVPHARDLIHPRRIVDVGCGRGAWLRAFKEIGVEFIQGLDGDYVDRDTLLIPAESFFSAALPGQGGTSHINEQWPEYWRRLFEARGYWMLDPIRPRIRDDKRVAWWYRQNILMFAPGKPFPVTKN